MAAVKVQVLVPFVPPGFTTSVVQRNNKGVLVRVLRHDICRNGEIIELDEEEMLKHFPHIEPGYIERAIANGLVRRCSQAEKPVKKANYGAYEDDAESGQKDKAAVPAKTNKND